MNSFTKKEQFTEKPEVIFHTSDLLRKEDCIIVDGVLYERLDGHPFDKKLGFEHRYRFFFDADDYDYLVDNEELKTKLDVVFAKRKKFEDLKEASYDDMVARNASGCVCGPIPADVEVKSWLKQSFEQYLGDLRERAHSVVTVIFPEVKEYGEDEAQYTRVQGTFWFLYS